MKIATTAIKSTGDLWLFNVVRLICEQHGTVYGVKRDHYRIDDARCFDFQVIKMFEFEQSFTFDSIVVSTSRPPYELEGIETGLIDKYYQHSLWAGYANAIIDHKTILDNPLYAIGQVSHGIDLNCDIQKVFNELKQINPPERGFDNKTLLTKDCVI